MSNWLNFEIQEKGYEPFKVTRNNLKQNIGKRIVYLRSRDTEPARGYAFPRYGVIMSVKGSQLIFDNHDSVTFKQIIEAGIKID